MGASISLCDRQITFDGPFNDRSQKTKANVLDFEAAVIGIT